MLVGAKCVHVSVCLCVRLYVGVRVWVCAKFAGVSAQACAQVCVRGTEYILAPDTKSHFLALLWHLIAVSFIAGDVAEAQKIVFFPRSLHTKTKPI